MAGPLNHQRAAVFTFALDDLSPAARRMERLVAWRSLRLGLPYGDQGLLISRGFYDAVGGFRPIELMEDVDIVRRIGRQRLDVLGIRAVTSAAPLPRWRLSDGARCATCSVCLFISWAFRHGLLPGSTHDRAPPRDLRQGAGARASEAAARGGDRHRRRLDLLPEDRAADRPPTVAGPALANAARYHARPHGRRQPLVAAGSAYGAGGRRSGHQDGSGHAVAAAGAGGAGRQRHTGNDPAGRSRQHSGRWVRTTSCSAQPWTAVTGWSARAGGRAFPTSSARCGGRRRMPWLTPSPT